MTSKCLDDNRLAAYAEGRLTRAEAEAATRHLAGCESCRTLATTLRALDDANGLDATAPTRPTLPRGRTVPLAPADSSARMDETALANHLAASSNTPHHLLGAPEGPLRRGMNVGRYIVLDLLGAGGMGAVYAAYDPHLDRRVAVKVLRYDAEASASDESRARLLREAQAMARLSHPNVLAVHDVGTHGDDIFIAIDLVEGEDLGEWLRASARTAGEILAVFVSAGRGLAAAHEAGLVHRDVKPANVLIGRDGSVRVADFGLVSPAGHSAPSSRGGPGDELTERESLAAWSGVRAPSQSLTVAGALLGTPAYMSPEQHRGEAATSASDQFSFCAALYEALAGVRPFAGETLADLQAAVFAGRMQAPLKEPGVRARVWAAVLKGLAKDPKDRHESMTALLTELAPRHGFDLGRAASFRRKLSWWFSGALLALHVGLGLLQHLGVHTVRPVDYLLATLALAAASAPFGRRLAPDAPTRRLLLVLGVLLTGQVATYSFCAFVLELPLATTLAVTLFQLGASIAIKTLTMEERIVWTAAVSLAAGGASALWPSAVFELVGVAYATFFLAAGSLRFEDGPGRDEGAPRTGTTAPP